MLIVDEGMRSESVLLGGRLPGMGFDVTSGLGGGIRGSPEVVLIFLTSSGFAKVAAQVQRYASLFPVVAIAEEDDVSVILEARSAGAIVCFGPSFDDASMGAALSYAASLRWVRTPYRTAA